MSRLAGMKDSRYKYFFGSRKSEELINWLAITLIASASSGEATHKELKQARGHSNKLGDAAMQQVRHNRQPAVVWTAAQMDNFSRHPKAMHCFIACRFGRSCDCCDCCIPDGTHHTLGVCETAQHIHICMFRIMHVHISSSEQVWRRMLHVLAGDGETVGHGRGQVTHRQGRGGLTQLQHSETFSNRLY